MVAYKSLNVRPLLHSASLQARNFFSFCKREDFKGLLLKMTCTPFVLLVACAAVVAVNAQNKPWFCQSYDCPAYTSQNMGGYEIRNYEESQWVATSITSTQPDPSRREQSSMFRKLFNYIQGANANRQRISMTVPVLTKTETRGPRDYRITMMFYLAVSNPPAPTGSGVVLVTRPAGNVFVRSFPGWFWPRSSTYRSEATQLERLLGDSSTQFDGNSYYKAGYNSPYDFFKKKQFEVWVDSQ